MADCTLTLDLGYGPDIPFDGKTVMVGRFYPANTGDMWVTTTREQVTLTADPFATIVVEQGVYYWVREPDNSLHVKLMPLSSTADYRDLPDIDSATLSPTDPPTPAFEAALAAEAALRAAADLLLSAQTDEATSTFGEIMRPLPSAVMPASRAAVTVRTSPPAWDTGVFTQWDEANRFTHCGPPSELVPGLPQFGCVYKTGGADSFKVVDNEFIFTGDKCFIRTYASGVHDLRVFIDDQSVSSEVIPTADGFTYMDIQFPAYTIARIRVAGGVAFQGVGHLANRTVRPAPPRFTLGIISDSYYEPNDSTLARTPAVELKNQTGFAIWNMAQGGTAYSNNAGGAGGRSEYGSADRISLVAAAPIDALLVNGSGNDGALVTTAAMKAKALEYYAKVAAVRPELPIIVVGIEPVNAFRSQIGSDLNEGLRQAAAEAPNVVGFIDAYTEQWLTGTGDDTHPAGDGNQDALIYGGDGVHLNASGGDYWQRMVATRLAPFKTRITA